MKTPLPNYLQPGFTGNSTIPQYTATEATINQLITYLAELTEMVEGKQEELLCRPGCEICRENIKKATLKEQLLNKFRVEFYDHDYENMSYSQIEAIINRLIP